MVNTNTKNIFDSMAKDYDEGNYDFVIKNVLDMKNHYSPGSFHYNLGTLYAQKKMYGVARYHFEKAKNIGYSSPLNKNNLEFVKSKIVISENSHFSSVYEGALYHLKEVPVDLYLLFSLILIFLSLVYQRFFIKKLSWRFLIPTLIIVFSIYFFQEQFLEKKVLAIALKKGQIYEGPSRIFKGKTLLPEGYKFIVSEVYEDWYYIQSPPSLAGWVKRENLGFL